MTIQISIQHQIGPEMKEVFFLEKKEGKKYLDPLVGVRHHGNQEVDQDDGGDQHVESKDDLEEIHQAGRVVRGHVELVVAERERKRILLWSVVFAGWTDCAIELDN